MDVEGDCYILVLEHEEFVSDRAPLSYAKAGSEYLTEDGPGKPGSGRTPYEKRPKR